MPVVPARPGPWMDLNAEKFGNPKQPLAGRAWLSQEVYMVTELGVPKSIFTRKHRCLMALGRGSVRLPFKLNCLHLTSVPFYMNLFLGLSLPLFPVRKMEAATPCFVGEVVRLYAPEEGIRQCSSGWGRV